MTKKLFLSMDYSTLEHRVVAMLSEYDSTTGTTKVIDILEANEKQTDVIKEINLDPEVYTPTGRLVNDRPEQTTMRYPRIRMESTFGTITGRLPSIRFAAPPVPYQKQMMALLESKEFTDKMVNFNALSIQMENATKYFGRFRQALEEVQQNTESNASELDAKRKELQNRWHREKRKELQNRWHRAKALKNKTLMRELELKLKALG